MSFNPQNYQQIARHSAWFSDSNQRVSTIPPEWLPWLQGQGSLTSALVKYSNGKFKVRVLSERWAKPYSREALKLNQPLHLAARIREVELLCNGQVMVFARSIIPLSVFASEPFTFQGMGSKPLGHLLFKDGRARIRQRSISEYRLGKGGSAVDLKSQTIFGRATPYEYHGGEILVSEFFVNPQLVAGN